MFGEFDFSKMNEQDVREAIVTPLLYRLGYREGTENNIIRNYTLKHPYIKYGRTDIPVRAVPDYILKIDNQISWVMDAKLPSENINDREYINQTHSYTAHPEVAGRYFALCNGLKLNVYETLSYRSDSSPIITLKYEEFENKFRTLENILGPVAMRHDFKPVIVDTGEPIGPELHSFARIVKGIIIFRSNDARLRAMDGFTTTILGGSVQRNKDGCIICDLDTCAPYASMQELNKQLGFNKFHI